MARSLDDTPTYDRNVKWIDFVEKFAFKKDDWHTVRFFGPVWLEYKHQVKTKNGKSYPEYCHGWDVDKSEFFPDAVDRCPCCALVAAKPELTKDAIKPGYRYLMNLIDIELADNKPNKPKPEWTPIRLVDLSPTPFARLKELKGVNKGVSVDNPKHGALLQIKYNPDTDPSKQYSVSMDTKDVALTEEQKAYTVLQKYPDGSSKIVKGENGLPAYFEYIRCVNSREDMVKSLRRNGYYGEDEDTTPKPSSASSRKSLDSYTREEKVARVDAETPVEVMDEDYIPFGGEDEEPAPQPPKTAKKANAPYEDCPAEFGDFASAVECFTQCGVIDKCREATELNSKKEEKATKEKVEVNDQEDDDDSI